MVLPDLRYAADRAHDGQRPSARAGRQRTVPAMLHKGHTTSQNSQNHTRRRAFVGVVLLLTLAACDTSREAAPESGTRAAVGASTTETAEPNGIDGINDMVRETWCEKNQRPWCTMLARIETEELRKAFMYLDLPYAPESGSIAITACEDLYEIIDGGNHSWRSGSVLASGNLLAYRDGEQCRVVEEFYGIKTAQRYETDGLHGALVIVESNETPFAAGRPKKLAEIEAATACARVEEYVREGLLIANSPVYSPLTRTAYEGYAAAAKIRAKALNCPALPVDDAPTR